MRLGYAIQRDGARLRLDVTDMAWEKLEDNLRRASQDDDGTGRQHSQVLSGWLEHAAPAYRKGKSTTDYRRGFVNQVCEKLATISLHKRCMPKRVIHHTWKRRMRGGYSDADGPGLDWRNSHGARRGSARADRKQRLPSDDVGRTSSRALLRTGSAPCWNR